MSSIGRFFSQISEKLVGFFGRGNSGGKVRAKGKGTWNDPFIVPTPRIGFLNLLGDSVASAVSMDQKILSPLFYGTTTSSARVPKCEVLFVYCQVDADGTIPELPDGIRKLIKDAGAGIAVFAAENDVEYHLHLERPDFDWPCNITLVADRKGDILAHFQARLFERMFAGESMFVAWNDLAQPMNPENHQQQPAHYFEAGIPHLAFLRPPNQIPLPFPRSIDRQTLAEDERAAACIKDAIVEYCRNQGHGESDYEIIAAVAAVTGERCMDAEIGNPTFYSQFAPGEWIFSEMFNVLMVSSFAQDEMATVPGDTIFGTVRDWLAGGPYRNEHFPTMVDVFGGLAQRVGNPDHWGRVPLSLPEEAWPKMLPLRVAYDCRSQIQAIAHGVGDDKGRLLRACSIATAMVLQDAARRARIDHSIALTLAFETINGMSKMSPMIGSVIDQPSAELREKLRRVNVIEVK